MFGKVFWVFFWSAALGVKICMVLPYDAVAGFVMGVYVVATYLFFIDLSLEFGIIVIINAFTLGYMLEFVAIYINRMKKPKQEPIQRGPMEEFKRAYVDQTFRRNYLFIKWQKDFDLIYNDHIGWSEGFSVGFFYQKEGDMEFIHQFVDGKRQDGWLVLEQETFGGPYKKYRFTVSQIKKAPQPEPISKDELVVG
jgi:hypothetical protein